MNFLLTILMFTLSAVLSILSALFVPNEDGAEFLFGLGYFFLGVAVITVFVTVFQTMALKQSYENTISLIKQNKKLIVLAQEKLAEYIKEASESMTKLYPEFEKEIFKNISPTNVNELRMYMAKYPEMKFNSVLEVHIENIRRLTAEIYEEKERLEYRYREIRDYQNSKWFLCKPKVDAELLKEIS